MMKQETVTLELDVSEVAGVYETTVVPLAVKSSRGWIWKTFAAIVFVVLCAAASLFFSWHMMKHEQKKIPILSGEQISTSTENGKVLQQIAESTKAAIHLHGALSGSPKQLRWVSDVDQSFQQGGLTLKNDQIHIPADGLYFVYSQVSYAVQCKLDYESGEVKQKYLSHIIWRHSEAMGEKKPLQSSINSVCQSGENGEAVYSSVYLGAVFKLLEGDKLSTETKHVQDIEDNPAKTFFGVFAL